MIGMGIIYTEEQQRVIDSRGSNVLVSAAAGSGKTAVLTERIVKMVSDEKKPVDIDRLLVVTFTNAAAAEMRERIGAAIAQRLETEPENEHLQKQAALVHNAQITTIDSFCMFVIRNNFNDIGLDPGFRVADEGELKLMKQDVMKELLEERFARKEKDFLHCVEYFSTGNRDDAIEGHILKLYQFAESNPWPEEWLEERKGDYELASLEELEQAEFIRFGMEQARMMAEDCFLKMEECIRICEQPDGPYMYGKILEEEAEKLRKLKEVERYGEGYAMYQGMAFGRLPSKKDDGVSPFKREMIQEIRKRIKDTVKNLCGKYFPAPPERVLEYIKGSSGAVGALIDVTLAFKKALDKRKRENNIIDFSDMEHLALSILVKKAEKGEGEEIKAYEPSRTALDYREYFEEILIDEYQDSNPVQEMLLESISRGENRFMVGDVKQSIYKFRLARPEIFMGKFEEYGKGGEKGKRIDLHKNFRSRTEVLDCVNFIFSRIMGKKLGGVEYNQEAALYPGASYPVQEQQDGGSPNRTELLLIRKEDSERDEEDAKQEGGEEFPAEGKKALSARQREAYAVAKRIKELAGHFPVTDKESGKLRKASYKDIVILLRTNAGWDEDFKSILKEEGIPSHVLSRTGYFAAGEIRALLQLLRTLDNPAQDIPLFGVLKSCFGGFTDEEIAGIRGSSEDRNKNLYDCLKEQAEEEGDLQEKIRQFLRFLAEYRDKTVYMPIHELLQDIVTQTGYLNYVSAMPGGGQRRANVQMLLEKAAAFEQTSYYGLFHFVRYMEQLEKYDVDYGEANILDENADVVRIMSIHKSKGLEFPVCFVSGLGAGLGRKEGSGMLAVDVDAGIGVDYVDPERRVKGKNLRKNAVALKLRRDSLAEELRILYVAMTRAEEKLILTGVVKNPEKTAAALLPLRRRKRSLLSYDVLLGQESLLTLLLSALSGNKCLDGFYGACGVETAPDAPEYADDMAVAVKLTGWDHVVEEKIEETVLGMEAKRKLLFSDPAEAVDENLLTELSRRFSYEYPHGNLRDLYTKTTVSELKMAGMQETDEDAARLFEEKPAVPYLPKFLRGDGHVSGSARGSAFHKVMELFDFQKLTNEVNKNRQAAEALLAEQMERMRKTGRLSQEYYEAVSVPKLVDFLTGGAALRMAEAARAGKLYKEQPFVMGLPASRLGSGFPAEETVLIQGIIDVFFEEEDGFVVLDYKTDAVSAAEELVKRYQVQLAYYSEALAQIYGYEPGVGGKPVKERIIYSFKLGEEILL